MFIANLPPDLHPTALCVQLEDTQLYGPLEAVSQSQSPPVRLQRHHRHHGPLLRESFLQALDIVLLAHPLRRLVAGTRPVG